MVNQEMLNWPGNDGKMTSHSNFELIFSDTFVGTRFTN